MTKPVIVHISADYPDPFQPNKTRAIISLVEATPEYRHVVYSLNRVNGMGGQIALSSFGADQFSVIYRALPYGLRWEREMEELAHFIADDLRARSIVPDVIYAHKFTVEGIVGYHLSRAFSRALVCDIQGNTDTKILRYKWSSRKLYRQMAKHVSVVFPYAPWPIKVFQRKIDLDPIKCRVLPVCPAITNMCAGTVQQNAKFISVFHLHGWRHKNVLGMVRAIANLRGRGINISLDIYGDGPKHVQQKIQNIIDRHGCADCIVLRGPISNKDLPDILQNYVGFLLPSHAETYGLALAESLLNGLPVLYPVGRAIDGYFDPLQIGYAANPKSIADIAKGIIYLMNKEAALKHSIQNMQKNGDLNILLPSSILQTYRAGIDAALSS